MQLLHLRTKILVFVEWHVSVALLEISATSAEVVRWYAMELA